MSEKIRISARSATLPNILSQVLAIRQLIENRDVGDIVGAPIDEWARRSPEQIKITVILFNRKEPPFSGNKNNRRTRVIYNIPSARITDINWNKIKLACGGNNGYMWGRFRAIANFDNGRQMHIYGASEQEAEQRLKAFAALSTAKITTLTISEEKREGLRATDKKMYKESTRVYPAYFSVVNSKKLIVESSREILEASGTTQGTFKRSKTKKIPLWMSQEPPNVKAIIREALRVRGALT